MTLPSEIKGKGALSAFAALIDPLCNLVEDEDTREMYRQEKKPEERSSRSYIVSLVYKILSRHEDDFCRIMPCATAQRPKSTQQSSPTSKPCRTGRSSPPMKSGSLFLRRRRLARIVLALRRRIRRRPTSKQHCPVCRRQGAPTRGRGGVQNLRHRRALCPRPPRPDAQPALH